MKYAITGAAKIAYDQDFLDVEAMAKHTLAEKNFGDANKPLSMLQGEDLLLARLEECAFLLALLCTDVCLDC